MSQALSLTLSVPCSFLSLCWNHLWDNFDFRILFVICVTEVDITQVLTVSSTALPKLESIPKANKWWMGLQMWEGNGKTRDRFSNSVLCFDSSHSIFLFQLFPHFLLSLYKYLIHGHETTQTYNGENGKTVSMCSLSHRFGTFEHIWSQGLQKQEKAAIC